MNISESNVEGLFDKIKERYVEQHADDALALYRDYKKIEGAMRVFEDWIERLQDGDIEVIAEYKAERAKLQRDPDSGFSV